tara:strand:- start:267 stop:440 length:174 start_codon:yes stop_codon:yes gene_type:complete
MQKLDPVAYQKIVDEGRAPDVSAVLERLKAGQLPINRQQRRRAAKLWKKHGKGRRHG